MPKLLLLLSLDMATLPMAMDTLLMDMLTMATTMARGLLMLDMPMDMVMVMDMAMVMDTTTMARGLLSLDMAMHMPMVMDMAMVMDTIAMAMASRFILNIPLKSSDVIPNNMLIVSVENVV